MLKMQMTQFNKRTCRPRDQTAAIAKVYPQAWVQIDEFRADRGHGLPAWADWCFIPLAATYAIASAQHGTNRLNLQTVSDVAKLAALGTWRVTQGIYRFDPAVYDPIRQTALNKDLPCDVLYHLPEWCIYIETPDMTLDGARVYGVYAHLEQDQNDGRHELRLLLDTDNQLIAVPLHIGAWTLADAMMMAYGEAVKYDTDGLLDTSYIEPLTKVVTQIMSLIIYICTQASEIDGTPSNPTPKKVRGQWRLFPAEKAKTWNVGVRMGAALRRAYHASETGQGHGGTVRPHIRRAHWHSYWVGSGDDKKINVKWLPPIAVNLDDDALPAVVRKVE